MAVHTYARRKSGSSRVVDDRRGPAPATGRALPADTRRFFEARFDHDFSQVRVHTDEALARSEGARAFTVGRDIVFDAGEYAPDSPAGRGLLAHELAHVTQQRTSDHRRAPVRDAADAGAEAAADRAAAIAVAGGRVPKTGLSFAGPVLQRQAHGTPSVTVRSPVFEELATQVSTLSGALQGRSLSSVERALVRGVFGTSVDYDRVRIVETDVLQYRTVGNVIRVPPGFTISDETMAQTLVHEMTHVWQYQHGGTSYISVSLGAQIAAQIRRGNRNFAYEYAIRANSSFFDFLPEQQGSIVENYFAMQRDLHAPATATTFYSNHFDASGYPRPLSRADRMTEISNELPLHERLVQQMRAALPRTEAELLQQRASEVMRTPGGRMPPRPELEMPPVKPLLEIRF